MIVKCTENISKENTVYVIFKDPPADEFDDDYYVCESCYSAEDAGTKKYYLTVGQEYTVYGMLLDNSELRFLCVDDQYNLPCWFPSSLFEITDGRIPYDWYYGQHCVLEHAYRIWGYRELATEHSHLVGLADDKPKDMKIFLKNKEEYYSPGS